MQVMEAVSTVAAAALPLFDIPLILHIIKRKSSADISVSWIVGLWICSVGMAPAAILSSEDIVWKTFNIVNVILLTGVLWAVLHYRKGSGTPN
ncbi:MAG: hypothetical protein KA403_02115 [Candidatus Omnitrophica bacterium]|nr:hypothetical protein [Candidatus Omnitrophota bacterium]